MTTEKTTITIEAMINAPVAKVWEHWTNPQHIIRWNNASDDWHTAWAENDLQEGGKFSSRMEARDGSMGFDFAGEYTKVDQHRSIEYRMGDDRFVQVDFEAEGDRTIVKEHFEAEQTHPIEMQRDGWQAILNNFKRHVENDKLQLLHFETVINAPAATVYKKMIDDDTYRQWTTPFNPTSYFEGSWSKGETIRFIGTDKDGNKGGMISRIKENLPNKFISIEHLGFVKGDTVVTSGPDVDEWKGALENYTFSERNGQTVVAVDTDSNEQFAAYFAETWPKALATLKEICEA